ncbi:MAG: hypothetical protein OIF57_15285 [Marinobacterium sp.]|nr:hypothetical protein [Marinobacterium sp.]
MFKAVLKVFSGDMVIMMSRFLGLFAVAIKLGIEELGVFSTLNALSSIVLPLAIWGGVNLTQKHIEKDGKGETCFIASLLLLIIVGAFLSFFASWLMFPDYLVYAFLILYAESIGIGVRDLLKSILFARNEYHSILIISIVPAISYLLFLAWFFFYLEGMKGLVTFIFGYNLLTFSVYMVFVYRSKAFLMLPDAVRVLLNGWYFKEGAGFVIAGFSKALYAQLDRVLVNIIAGNAASGVYNIAATCAGVALMPVYAYAQIVEPRFYSISMSVKEKLQLMYGCSLKTIVMGLAIFFASLPVAYVVSIMKDDFSGLLYTYSFFMIFLMSMGALQTTFNFLNGVGRPYARFVLTLTFSALIALLANPLISEFGVESLPIVLGFSNFIMWFGVYFFWRRSVASD